MDITSNHSHICLKTWINCENLLNNISKNKRSVSGDLKTLISECSHVLMGTFHALKTNSCNIQKVLLLCIGICEECADRCLAEQNDDLFLQCALACRECASKLTELSLFSVSNN